MQATSTSPRPSEDLIDSQAPASPEVELRRYRPQDESAVMAAVRCLSLDTFYQRFFTLMPDRSVLVRPLLARVDHRDHELFVAWVDSRVVGLAQWDRSTTDAGSAEVAVVVADAWQRRGIGTRLMGVISSHARRQGVTELHAHLLTTNVRAMNLARSLGPTDRDVDGPETHVTFSSMAA